MMSSDEQGAVIRRELRFGHFSVGDAGHETADAPALWACGRNHGVRVGAVEFARLTVG